MITINGQPVTEDFLKEAACAVCAARGLDPEDQVMYPHPEGFLVVVTRLRWKDVVEVEIKPLLQILSALGVLK